MKVGLAMLTIFTATRVFGDEITVTNPDSKDEKVVFTATNNVDYPIKLKNSGWSCKLKKREPKPAGVFVRDLFCTKGTDIVVAFLFCQKNFENIDALLVLIEKEKPTTISVSCM